MLTATQKWKRGAVGAAINSAAAIVPVLIADPAAFNPFDGGWKGAARLVGVIVGSAIAGSALWLKNHPLPIDDDESTPTAAAAG